MNRMTRTHQIALLLTAIGALLLLVGTAQASSRPAGMTKAEYRALMIRSEALNAKYGLGDYAGRPAAMSAAEYRALMIRSRGLNEKYGVGASAAAAPKVAAPLVAGDAFAWGDFGIGAAAMLGGILLAAGVFAGGRHGRDLLRLRSSS